MVHDCNVVWLLQKAPNVLALHLKKFTSSGQKIEAHVLFELNMEFTPYMSADATDGYVPKVQCVISQTFKLAFCCCFRYCL